MTEMTFFQWALLILLYLLGGLLYCFIYLLAIDREEGNVWVGIMAALWPLYIVLDIVLQLAASFGKSYIAISNRVFHKLDR